MRNCLCLPGGSCNLVLRGKENNQVCDMCVCVCVVSVNDEGFPISIPCHYGLCTVEESGGCSCEGCSQISHLTSLVLNNFCYLWLYLGCCCCSRAPRLDVRQVHNKLIEKKTNCVFVKLLVRGNKYGYSSASARTMR
jgi:hypothetical protein